MIRCLVALAVFCGFVCAEPIEVVCAEFPKAQVDEMTAIVRATEAMCAEYFGDDVLNEDDGTLIELHRQFRDYESIDEELNDGEFRRTWRFANYVVRQGHIALQPPIPVEMMNETGLPLQTMMEISRISVYLCIYRSFNNYRSHTSWFGQGLSVHFASEAIRSIDVMRGIEEEPWTSTQIVQVQEYLDEQPDFGIDDILNDVSEDISATKLFAMRGLFIDWLEDLGLLDTIINEARRLGGGESYASRLNEFVNETMREAGIKNRDLEFRAWLGKFEPQWEQLVRSLDTTDGEMWAHSAFSRRTAIAWNNEELGDDDWVLSGSFKIYDGDKTQMNILLGREDSGYMSIALGPSFGVTVFHRQINEKDDKSKWIRLVNEEVRTLELEEWSTFKISKRRDRLMIKINKGRPVRLEVKDIELTGEWGLGCQNKSAGVWKDVKLER